MDYTDLLDKPLQVGDYIAWPTMSGSSPCMSIGQIVDFPPALKNSYVSKAGYRIKVKPLSDASTSYYFSARKWNSQTKQYDDRDDGIKPVILQKVENVVKVEVPAHRV